MDNLTKRNLLAYSVLRGIIKGISDSETVTFDTKNFYDENGLSLSCSWEPADQHRFQSLQFLLEAIVPLNCSFTMGSLLPTPGQLEPGFRELDNSIHHLLRQILMTSSQLSLIFAVDKLFETLPCQSLSMESTQECDDEGELYPVVEVSVQVEPGGQPEFQESDTGIKDLAKDILRMNYSTQTSLDGVASGS